MKRQWLTVEEWSRWIGVSRSTIYARVSADRAGVSRKPRNGKKKLVISSDRIRIEFPERFRGRTGKDKFSETILKLDRLSLEVRQLREVVVEAAAAIQHAARKL